MSGMKRNPKMLSVFCFAVMFSCKTSLDAEILADAQGEGDGPTIVICETAGYTQEELNNSFYPAYATLQDRGVAVDLTRANEDEFQRLLVVEMVHVLGCTPEQSIDAGAQRRNGPSSCEVVTDLPEDEPAPGVFYCGGEARSGTGCWLLPWRAYVDDCLNYMCWEHDLCYEDLESTCFWGDGTEECDVAFHLGVVSCVARHQCGFWCLMVATIAANIDALQEAGKLQGETCLYPGGGDDPGSCSSDRCDAGTTERKDAPWYTLDGGSWTSPDAGVLPDVGTPDAPISADAPSCIPSSEICDGEDNNCDGEVDEGCGQWADINIFGAPTAREAHTAIWTGSEMIIWGGLDSSESEYEYLNTGKRYNPVSNSWLPVTTTGAPSLRASHTAIWTGSEMIIWGGVGELGLTLNTGGRYDPATDSWVEVGIAGAPTDRFAHTAVWTGSEMIVWGGLTAVFGGDALRSGGRYNPTTNTWAATPITSAPSARSRHTAVWTGSEMIVWGGTETRFGQVNTGGRYNSTTDTWRATTTVEAPTIIPDHTAIWTSTEMIVWGAPNINGIVEPGRGAIYTPSTNTWRAVSAILWYTPSERTRHSTVWTGSEMIVWGGYGDGGIDGYDSGGQYHPATNTWVATSVTNAPSQRIDHTAIWTGSEMVVWGGNAVSDVTNTGGLYAPP